MKTTHHPYNTPAEAQAFLDGVEYVNDSAINAFIDPDDPKCVVTEDEDKDDDDESEEQLAACF